MKRLVIVFVLVLALLITVCGQALAQVTPERQINASFSVAQVIDLTLSDLNSDGLEFGPVIPGAQGIPDTGAFHGETPSVTLSLGSGTNVTCNITMRGTDFVSATGGRTVPITSVRWNTVGSYVQGNQVTGTEQTVITDLTGASDPAGLWYFLSLPTEVLPGTYTGSVYFKAVAQ